MDEQQEIKQLYQLYLTNQCSADELERFFVLIKASKEDQTMLSLMSDSWDQIPEVPEQGLVPDFLPKAPKQIQLQPSRSERFPFRKIAAAAAVLLIVTGFFFYRSTLRNTIDGVYQLEVSTQASQRRQLELPDGSKVWLSPNSKLTYPEQFGKDSRTVNLVGEAFFEVTHDTQHPFIVQSGTVRTKVLGTSFNVSAYPQQAEMDVTLVTGKVAVNLQNRSELIAATITANQRITVNKEKYSILKMDYPYAADYLNRRMGIFDYKGARLAEVIQDLELQYQTNIQLNPELNQSMFYGNLDMTKPLTHTLQKLCTVMEVKLENRTITHKN